MAASREDLYFRLNVFPIDLVPLRERAEDIRCSRFTLLRGATKKLKTGELRLTEGDARRLSQYAWPGNVRELQNVIERATILARKRPRPQSTCRIPAARLRPADARMPPPANRRS
ncbi:MAG: hypothetical protein WDN48_08275 [Pseudolabrys sp.]